MKNKITDFLIYHQPYRVILKSIRNIFFPLKYDNINEKWISIEVSSICNAKCIFCNYKLGYRKGTLMDFSMYKNIIKSCQNMGINKLGLTSMGGEFFLHTKAVPMIKEAQKANFNKIEIHTNGILLYKHNIKELLTSGLTDLLISFPGFEESIFLEIYQTTRFNDFKKSITQLLENHKQLKSNVTIRFEPRTYLSKKQIKNSVFYKEFVLKYISDKIILSDPLKIFDSWSGEIKNKDLKKGMKLEINPIKSLYPFKKVNLCYRLLTKAVKSNGEVRICNCRYDSTIDTPSDIFCIGNIKDYKNLSNLILKNQNKIKSLQIDFHNGNIPKLCKNCSFYVPVNYKP
ncbi:MAG: radical SAM protein [Spirochaetia bacterium]|nr:radical SAM protein [Spirochaetia bacterium]